MTDILQEYSGLCSRCFDLFYFVLAQCQSYIYADFLFLVFFSRATSGGLLVQLGICLFVWLSLCLCTNGQWGLGQDWLKDMEMATSIDKENLHTVCLTLRRGAWSTWRGQGKARKPLGKIKYKLLQNVIKKPLLLAGNLIYQSEHGQ